MKHQRKYERFFPEPLVNSHSTVIPTIARIHS